MSQPNAPAQIISYQALRQFIGWLGLLSPAVLMAGNFLIRHCGQVQSSISHYYYTVTGAWFVGILFAVAMFLFSYKGYDRVDAIVASVAGFTALGIALFPTNMMHQVPAPIAPDPCILFTLREWGWRNAVHYASAAIFFLALAGNALFLFTKSGGPLTAQKKARNKLFVACGCIMLLALLLIALYGLYSDAAGTWAAYHPVFWLEWLALAAFGLSWLVKGQLIFKDSQPQTDHKDM